MKTKITLFRPNTLALELFQTNLTAKLISQLLLRFLIDSIHPCPTTEEACGHDLQLVTTLTCTTDIALKVYQQLFLMKIRTMEMMSYMPSWQVSS